MNLFALSGIPQIGPDDKLADVVCAALSASGVELQSGDILCCCSKIVSKAEDRFVDLSRVEPSSNAISLAQETDKDPRLVECILRESERISRKRPGALIVRHRIGIVSANAAIDSSNAKPPGAQSDTGPWILLLPEAPDRSATILRNELCERLGVDLSIVITDSLGRPFRTGTVGTAIGTSGVSAIWDQRGRKDLDERTLEYTISGFADSVAAAADLLAGQAAEGSPLIVVRGLRRPPYRVDLDTATALQRDPDSDLYL